MSFLCLLSFQEESKVGVDQSEGPPVPIPNTEVKLASAEDTCLETGWENRQCLHKGPVQPGRTLSHSSIAQSVEHAAVNRRVVGSSPTWGAKFCTISSVGRATDS